MYTLFHKLLKDINKWKSKRGAQLPWLGCWGGGLSLVQRIIYLYYIHIVNYKIINCFIRIFDEYDINFNQYYFPLEGYLATFPPTVFSLRIIYPISTGMYLHVV